MAYCNIKRCGNGQSAPIYYENNKLIIKDESVVENGIPLISSNYPSKILKIGTIDGEWKINSFPASIFWSIAYGNGKYITLLNANSSYGTNKYLYSEDGMRWEEKQFGFTSYFTKVFFGNNKFFVLDSNTKPSLLIYSEDGLIWKASNLPKFSGEEASYSVWRDFCVGPDKFAIVSYSSATTFKIKSAYSYDGITWTISKEDFPYGVANINFANNKFLITVGLSTYYSVDGITWIESTTLSSLTDISLTQIISFKDKFICPIGQPAYTTTKFIYSTDAINWNEGTFPISGHFFSKTYGIGNNKIIFLQDRQGQTQGIESEDGINWHSIVGLQDIKPQGMCYDGSKFIVIPYNGSIYYYKQSETGLMLE